MSSLISIAQIPLRIAHLTDKAAPSYRQVYMATLTGKFPAAHIRGRWYVEEADLAKVATALGFALPTKLSPSRLRRETAA